MSTGPTIADIARLVGVSVPTVSKVLNGRADVSAATRAKVESALAEAGYQRRTPAPGGEMRRSDTLIEMVFHRLGSPWANELLTTASQAASTSGHSLVVTELSGLSVPSNNVVDSLVSRRPAGVIMVASHMLGPQFARLRRRGIPLVMIDPDGDPPADVPTVGSDNWTGGVAAGRHLLSLGHKRIGVIAGPDTLMAAQARLDGFRTAHAQAGVEFDESLIRPGNYYLHSGDAMGRELLSLPSHRRPTAIFAGSDIQALGVLRAAASLGLSVPHDVSVIGYDDVPEASWVSPELTTVSQHLPSMAKMAVELLHDLMAGRTPTSGRLNVTPELVVRSSTAPPPA